MEYSRKRKPNKQIEASGIPIKTIVTYYGGEVKDGRAAAVKCVMHNESRASAVINTYDNLYYCHRCGKGGNAVNIIMIKEELEFRDALKRAHEILAGSGQSLRGSDRRGNAKLSKRSWNI